MRIYFLRHGAAVERAGWERDDALRPLTGAGRRRLERIADTLADLDLGLGAIITSPLVRARQTAEIVAARLGVAWAEDARLAPGCDAARLCAVLRDHPDAATIMVVGHEPDLGETIGALIGGGRVACRKGGLALVNLPDASSREGQLAWLVPPRILARG